MTIHRTGDYFMDLLIAVDELESGMVLSRPVKRESQLLYPEGKNVSPREIYRLKKWGVEKVYVETPEMASAS